MSLEFIFGINFVSVEKKTSTNSLNIYVYYSKHVLYQTPNCALLACKMRGKSKLHPCTCVDELFQPEHSQTILSTGKIEKQRILKCQFHRYNSHATICKLNAIFYTDLLLMSILPFCGWHLLEKAFSVELQFVRYINELVLLAKNSVCRFIIDNRQTQSISLLNLAENVFNLQRIQREIWSEQTPAHYIINKCLGFLEIWKTITQSKMSLFWTTIYNSIT